MFGMLNQNVHRTFWLKVPKGQRTKFWKEKSCAVFSNMSSSQLPLLPSTSAAASKPSSEGSWDVIEAAEASELIHRSEAEAADFLLTHEVPMAELSATLQANMQDLQDAINKLAVKDAKIPDTKDEVMAAPEEVDLGRPGLGFTPAAVNRVPPAPSSPVGDRPGPGFVRPANHPPVFMPVRYEVDAQNNAFCRLLAFPASFPSIPNYLVNLLQTCSEQELLSLFEKFMHAPITEASARRILEAYIPMKAQCTHEAVWSLGALPGRGRPGLGSSTLKSRPLGSSDYTHMCSSCHAGWPDRATSCFLCKKGEKVPFEAPSAIFEQDGTTWILAPRDGRPTWIQMEDPTSGSSSETQSKLAHSIDATQMAQQPMATNTQSEVTMADTVPIQLRMSMREEVLEQTVDQDAAMAADLLREQRDSLHSRKGQGFQIFHPEAAKTLDLQSKALQHADLLARDEAADLEAKRQKIELISDMVDQNMEVLGPLQEGMQEAADSQIMSKGVELLRRTNLETLREKLKTSLLEGQRTTVEAIESAQTSLTEAKEANKRVQEQGQAWMQKYTLVPEDPSLWPEEFKTKMEQGLFCPVDADLDETRLPPADLTRRYLAFLVTLSQNKYVPPPRLLSEMPKLNVEMATSTQGSPGAPGPETSGAGYNQLTPEAEKLAMLTWALKFHKGEQRMHAGVWRRTEDIAPPAWALQLKLTVDQLGALERRTHVEQYMEDPMDPVLFNQDEVDKQISEGQRPAIGDIQGVFWADGANGKWRRETRTWDLPSLVHVYGHRYSFRFIYAAWCQMPIALPQHRRGKDAPTSATATRAKAFEVARKEAKAFVKLHGMEPESKADWVLIFKEMGRFLAAKSFLSNCPAPVMSMPIQPLHDSKEALRFRAVCDERVTLPLAACAEHPEVH